MRPTVARYSISMTIASSEASAEPDARGAAGGERGVTETGEHAEKHHDEYPEPRGGAQAAVHRDMLVEKRVDVAADTERRFKGGDGEQQVGDRAP